MFTAAVVTIARTWKQPKYPSIDEWIRCGIYIRVYTPHTPHTHTHTHTHTMEYYSAIKRNETRSSVMMWMEVESVIQSEVSQKEKKSNVVY